MTKRSKGTRQKDGRRIYEQDRARLMADPKLKRLYDEEAAKKEIWLQLAETRLAAGLTQEQLAERLGTTQSQISRIEKRGEDITIGTLRRYVSALGKDLALKVKDSAASK